MVDLTQEEKQLLLAAKKLRQTVQHDISRTTKPFVSPFIKEVVAVLLTQKKVSSTSIKKLPTAAWVKLANNVSSLIGRTAVKTASHQTQTRETLAFVEKSLGDLGDSKQVASALVLASVKLAAAHKKTPSANLLKALALVDLAQQEISLLREFV